MNTTSTALQVTATYNAAGPSRIEFRMELPTEADAIAFVARFPRARKLRATTLTRHGGTPGAWTSTVTGYVQHSIRLAGDGVNGGANEAGAARYSAIMRDCAKLGVEVEWTSPYGNSYGTREEFEALLAGC